MSDPSYVDAPDSPPPPAYEFSQQEFDQKVSHALEASQTEQQRVGDAQEEWEEWDEEAFLAAAAHLEVSDTTTSPGASSSSQSPPPSASAPMSSFLPDPSPGSGNGKGRSDQGMDAEDLPGGNQTMQPLRIQKKSAQTPYAQSGKEKERPSWLEEAQLGGPPSPAPVAHRMSDFRADVHRSDSMRSMSSSTPPPEFTAVGPSLDGPPYEEPAPMPQPSGVVLTYVPGDSRPASPLNSPVAVETHLPHRSLSPQFSPPYSGRRSLPQPPPSPRSFAASSGPQNRTGHQSLPATQRILPQSNSRPYTGYSAKSAYPVPRVAFDPRVAYANEKSSHFGMANQDPLPTKVDAAALYSSAVSSLYANVPPPPPLPRNNISTPSTNLGPYSSHSASQSHSSYHLPQTTSSYHLPQSTSSYHLPQTTAPAASTYSLHNYPNSERSTSPAPSVMSTTSQHTTHSQYSTARHGYQPQQNNSRPGTVYQPSQYQNQAQTTYQPQPSYARPRYQSSSYQSSYQPTSF